MDRGIIEGRYEYRGYEYIVLLHEFGHYCGYVGIPRKYDYLSDEILEDIDCTQGINYINRDMDHPFNQTTSDKFWIGFDCGYIADLKDIDKLIEYGFSIETIARAKRYNKHSENLGGVLKNNIFIISECKKIIDSLIERIGE